MPVRGNNNLNLFRQRFCFRGQRAIRYCCHLGNVYRLPIRYWWCFETANETILTVNRSVLDAGSFVNVTPTYLTGQQNNSDGFTIVGRNATASGSATYTGDLKWEYDIDLTNIEEVSFYCKKELIMEFVKYV